MYTVRTKPGCTYCTQAKELLKQKGLPFEEELYGNSMMIEEFVAEGFRTFPQIWDGDHYIGGFDQLKIYLAQTTGDDF